MHTEAYIQAFNDVPESRLVIVLIGAVSVGRSISFHDCQVKRHANIESNAATQVLVSISIKSICSVEDECSTPHSEIRSFRIALPIHIGRYRRGRAMTIQLVNVYFLSPPVGRDIIIVKLPSIQPSQIL